MAKRRISTIVCIVVFALVAVQISALRSRPQISVEETTQIFFDYMRFGEYELAYNFLTHQQQAQYQRKLFYLDPPWGDNWWSIAIAINEYHAPVSTDGESKEVLQKVMVRGNNSMGQKATYELRMVLEGLEWKIAGIELKEDRGPSGHGQADSAEQAAKIPPLMAAGRRHYQQDQLRKGIGYFSKVLEIRPGNADAHAYLGMCYGKMAGKTKDVWKAIDFGIIAWIHHETALEIDPDHLLAHLGRGQGLLFAPEPFGNVQSAMEDFRFVIERDAQNEEAALMMALAYKKEGKEDRARHMLRRALEINPGYQAAKDELGKLKDAVETH
jgi:tetratricopeptide (TPR) repeat protein